MLDKAAITRLLEELYVNDSASLLEDFEAWGIEAEAILYVMVQMSSHGMMDTVATGNARGAFDTIFCAAFGLGYKCALELEMERIRAT